jgi:hypothetical protein
MPDAVYFTASQLLIVRGNNDSIVDLKILSNLIHTPTYSDPTILFSILVSRYCSNLVTQKLSAPLISIFSRGQTTKCDVTGLYYMYGPSPTEPSIKFSFL